ncbi:MAG TPA: hydantoinase B/oxoprolinase family protein, partial [Pirellulales bacterium]|nr:hydantoinase B/oxoprolinase family protein [Pirellulales bacterium]
VLRNTASSVNVKERLDFSCALFTAEGDLVVNAPHIPVHLGAMAETVKRIVADNPDLAPGDTYVTNDPYRGGSHLPDVTVITPVHEPESGRLLFFTASRAHHAEIGGVRPGSLPPLSRNLAEEGVLIRNFKLLDRGRSRIDELARLLSSAPYPTRNLHDNLADVTAQLAANRLGARELGRLVERYSLAVVQSYMGHIQAAAERKVRARLAALPDGRLEFVDHLDDGAPIAAAITIAGDSATIDFTGTGPVVGGNLNANRAIVTAAVMYSLRVLLDEDIPLNQGVLAPVRIVLPECLLNPREGPTPEQSPAVVGGNVETSQRTVDVLWGALELAAASQGTMNSMVFGDTTFGYYETICGGSGATSQGPGADAVHTHMTNTRLTDPEVLEQRYPVRVREFFIRRGSGGRGVHRGGDGVVRRLEFLRELEVSIVSQRRGPYPPYGLAGGEPGMLGRNWLQRADGSVAGLSGSVQFRAQPGDVLTIETPGGGGWGRAETSRSAPAQD